MMNSSAQDDANLSSFTLSTLDEILDLEQLEMAPVRVTGEGSLPESPPVSPANEAAQAAAMLISSFNLGGDGSSAAAVGPSLSLNGDSPLMIVNAQPTTTHSSASHSNDSNNNNLLHHLQMNGLSDDGHSPLPLEANIASDHDYYTAKPASAVPRTATGPETLLVLSTAPNSGSSTSSSSRQQPALPETGDITLEYLTNGQAFELEVAHHVELVDETTAPAPAVAPSLSPLRLSPVRKIQYIRPLAPRHPRPVVGNQQQLQLQQQQQLQPAAPVRPFAYSPIRTTTHQKSVRGPKLPKPQGMKMTRPVPSVLPSSSFSLESRPASSRVSAPAPPSNLPPIKYKLHSNQNYRKRQQKRSQETSMLDTVSRTSLAQVSTGTTPKSPPTSPSTSPPDFKVIRVISQSPKLVNGYGPQAPQRQASRTLTMRPNGGSTSTSSAKSAISPAIATAMLSSFASGTPGIATAMANSKEKDPPIKKPRYGAIERRAASATSALAGEPASSTISKGRKSAASAGESQVNYLNKVKRPVGRPRKTLPAEPKPPKTKKPSREAKQSKETAKQAKVKAEKRTKTPVIKENETEDPLPTIAPSTAKVAKPRVNEFKSVPMEEEREVASPALPSDKEDSSDGEADKGQEEVEEMEEKIDEEVESEEEVLPKVASPSKAPLSFIPIASTSRGSAEAKRNPFELVECQQFEEEDEPPFHVKMKADTLAIMDLHAHCLKTEIIGLLGGHYCRVTKTVHIKTAEPCPSMVNDTISCEIDPVSQAIALEKLEAQNYQVVGWYHSHPTFSPEPSNRDIETQSYYQRMFNEISSHSSSGRPYVALILSPFTKPDIRQLKPSASFQVTLPQQTYEGRRFYSGDKKYAYADFTTRQVRYLSPELNGLLASPYKCFWVANSGSEDADLMIPYEMRLELHRDERLVPSIVGTFGPMCQWIARDYGESTVRLGKTFTRIGSISVNYLDKIIASLTHHLQAIAGEQEVERVRQEVIAILVEEFQPPQEKE